jgi:hypothetical protein
MMQEKEPIIFQCKETGIVFFPVIDLEKSSFDHDLQLEFDLNWILDTVPESMTREEVIDLGSSLFEMVIRRGIKILQGEMNDDEDTVPYQIICPRELDCPQDN